MNKKRAFDDDANRIEKGGQKLRDPAFSYSNAKEDPRNSLDYLTEGVSNFNLKSTLTTGNIGPIEKSVFK